MGGITFAYDGREFSSREEMFEYASSNPSIIRTGAESRTENEILDDVLNRQFPNHTNEIMNYLRGLKVGTKREEMNMNEMTPSEMQRKISVFFDNSKEFLIEKNRRSGLSTPSGGTFYKGDSSEGILLRLDDSLNRIKNSERPMAADFHDLIGNLALYCCSMGEEDDSWTNPQRYFG